MAYASVTSLDAANGSVVSHNTERTRWSTARRRLETSARLTFPQRSPRVACSEYSTAGRRSPIRIKAVPIYPGLDRISTSLVKEAQALFTDTRENDWGAR